MESKEEVIEWMFDIQLGRRNLSPIQRITVAERYRPLYEKEAKENQSKAGKEYGNGGIKLTANLPQALDKDKKERNPTTDKKLADMADVSEKIYRMGVKILNSDNEDLKKRVQTGETSISAGYKELTQGKILKDLIETNIRQRGIGNPNPIKLGRCIKELEQIYGVRDGSAGQSEPKLSGGDVLYQSDIAEMIGISVDTLQNYKKLTELVPELQDWGETREKTAPLAIRRANINPI